METAFDRLQRDVQPIKILRDINTDTYIKKMYNFMVQGDSCYCDDNLKEAFFLYRGTIDLYLALKQYAEQKAPSALRHLKTFKEKYAHEILGKLETIARKLKTVQIPIGCSDSEVDQAIQAAFPIQGMLSKQPSPEHRASNASTTEAIADPAPSEAKSASNSELRITGTSPTGQPAITMDTTRSAPSLPAKALSSDKAQPEGVGRPDASSSAAESVSWNALLPQPTTATCASSKSSISMYPSLSHISLKSSAAPVNKPAQSAPVSQSSSYSALYTSPPPFASRPVADLPAATPNHSSSSGAVKPSGSLYPQVAKVNGAQGQGMSQLGKPAIAPSVASSYGAYGNEPLQPPPAVLAAETQASGEVTGPGRGMPNEIQPLPPPVPTPGLARVHFPVVLIKQFLERAKENTLANIETAAVLAGERCGGEYFITHMVFPKQKGSSDNVETEGEEELIEWQAQNRVIIMGWIHTHPTQSCFLSSIDLHCQFGYQVMVPEALAIVCAPSYGRTGIFSLTQLGMKVVGNCKLTRFHPHNPDTGLYLDTTHVTMHYPQSHPSHNPDLSRALMQDPAKCKLLRFDGVEVTDLRATK